MLMCKRKKLEDNSFQNNAKKMIRINAKRLYEKLIEEEITTKQIAKRIEQKYILYYANHIKQEATAKEIVIDFVKIEKVFELINSLKEKGKVLFYSEDSCIEKDVIAMTKNSWFVVTDKFNNGTIRVIFCV